MLALSPARRVAGQVNAPAGRIVSQLKTKAESKEEAGAEPAPAAAT
jgi:hypothetical protein